MSSLCLCSAFSSFDELAKARRDPDFPFLLPQISSCQYYLSASPVPSFRLLSSLTSRLPLPASSLQIKAVPFKNFFRPRTDPVALDLLAKIIVYAPEKRLDAYQVLAHPFFDDIKVQGIKLAHGGALPGLFK